MLARWRPALALMPLLLAGAFTELPAAFAQSSRPWVDPPPELMAPATPPEHARRPDPPTSTPRPRETAPPGAPAGSGAAPIQPPTPSVRAAHPQDVQAPPRPLPQETKSAPIPSPHSGEEADGSELAAKARAAQELAVTYLEVWSAPNAHTLAATPDFYTPLVNFHGRSMTRRELIAEKRRFVQRWPQRRYLPRPDSMRVSCEPGGQTCTVHSVFDFAAANPRRGRRSRGVATHELTMRFFGARPYITAENSKVYRSEADRASIGDDANE